jgi:hypothetical protein
MSRLDSPHRDRSDLPLRRWGVLSVKSLCTCRRWNSGKASQSARHLDELTAISPQQSSGTS